MGRNRSAGPRIVLMGFVLSMAACTDTTSNATDGQRPAGADGAVPAVFTERCGQCHLPPRRTAHHASEWPSVVERMQRHIAQKGRQRIGPGERAVILDYLMNGGSGLR